MARLKKQTVDYFPHVCKCGRTIFILESRFGNDGYAFWFKLLEILGESDGHFYDCSNASNWAFLLAKTHTDEERANDIVNVLIDLGKIDAELWAARRIIWIENFVRNLSELYRRRVEDLPKKPAFIDENQHETNVSDGRNLKQKELLTAETDKVKESKVKERKEKKYPYQGICDLWNSTCVSLPKVMKLKKELLTAETDKVKESKVKERKEKKYPYQGICDLWNSTCVSLPKVMKLTERRKQKIECRLDEFGVQPEQWLETAENLFKRVQASDFLTGRSANKQNWAASFDWFFENSSNWVKVSEGNYDNKGVRSPQSGSKSSIGLLGVGEFLDGTGRRTYGSGRATIPQDAPPRPSERHQWSAESQTWIML